MTPKIEKGDVVIYDYLGSYAGFKNDNKAIPTIAQVTTVYNDGLFLVKDLAHCKAIHNKLPLDDSYTLNLSSTLSVLRDVAKPVFRYEAKQGYTKDLLNLPEMFPQYFI